MISVYSDNEKQAAFRTKKIMLAVWLVVFALVAAVEITLFTVHFVRVETLLDRSYQTPFAVISVVIAIAFSFGSLFFFGTKYRMVKAYCRMYKDMRQGQRDSDTGVVLEKDDALTEKYSVLFHSITVECPPIRRGQRNVRTLLIEKDHSAPRLTPGTRFKFTAHANIIISYEVIAPSPVKEEGSGGPAVISTQNNKE